MARKIPCILAVAVLLAVTLACNGSKKTRAQAQNSNVPDAYRSLYRQLDTRLQQLRRRNLVLVIEIGTTFKEPEFSSLNVDYQNLILARSRGKSVSIGEAWMYKAADSELGRITPTKVYARDVYSFWQPLDQRFLELVVDLSRREQASFCSFFWMKYSYSYLDYSPKTRRMSAGKLLNASSALAGRNILEGRLSLTGQRFKALIAPD